MCHGTDVLDEHGKDGNLRVFVEICTDAFDDLTPSQAGAGAFDDLMPKKKPTTALDTIRTIGTTLSSAIGQGVD